jgi:hypothetical protein
MPFMTPTHNVSLLLQQMCLQEYERKGRKMNKWRRSALIRLHKTGLNNTIFGLIRHGYRKVLPNIGSRKISACHKFMLLACCFNNSRHPHIISDVNLERYRHCGTNLILRVRLVFRNRILLAPASVQTPSVN